MRSVFALVLCLALTGCGVELLTTTAIQGELQTQQMQAMKRQVQSASDTSGRVTLERAIQTYRAEKGGNPPSLASLVPDYMPAVPKRGDGTEYGYDPARGQLFFEVCVRKAVTCGVTFVPLHAGHFGLAFSRSEMVMTSSNSLRHFSQRNS